MRSKNLSKTRIGATGRTGAEHREQAQRRRYCQARRSIKIWPVEYSQADEEKPVREFLINVMEIPTRIARSVILDTIKTAEQTQNSKITNELLVTFAETEDRDVVKSYANKLAKWEGKAGLRLDVPPHLKGSFRILTEHGLAIRQLYGKDVKRNIKFDDRNENLMMDIKLPTSLAWQNVTIEQAREAMRIRDEIDKRNMRSAGALQGNQSTINKERAKVLMLSLSPRSDSSFKSTLGPPVVNLEDFEESEQSSFSQSETDYERGIREGMQRARRETESSK